MQYNLSTRQKEIFTNTIGGIILISILLFPPVVFKKGVPAIELLDFLLPFLLVYIVVRRKEILVTKSLWLIGILMAVIFLSMAINSRLGEIRDYFEYIKLLKFGCLIILFSWIDAGDFMQKWIKPIFIALTIFNLIHFFGLFHFNQFLDQFYLGNGRYLQFGLDSAGMPTYKRMLGFAGNPNNNAIIFSIFSILFLPKKNSNRFDYVYLFVSILMVFLCQSRTAMVAILAILVIYALLNLKELKKILMSGLIISAGFGIAFIITTKSASIDHANYSIEHSDSLTTTSGNDLQEYTYLESAVHGEFTQGASMKGRYEIWNHLWKMIKEKPLLGHAPYKEYFYDNGLYAENEFILITWRYGFVGLIIYLLFLFSLTFDAVKNRTLHFGQNLILVVVLITVTSLTNNPFANKTIIVLFAIVAGLFYNQLRSKSSD